MEDKSFRTKYAYFTIFICIAFPLIGLLGYLSPKFNLYPMQMSKNDKELYNAILITSLTITSIPAITSLIGFYTFGALGRTRSSINLLGGLMFSLTLSIALVSILLSSNTEEVFKSLISSGHPNSSSNLTYVLYLINLFIQLFIFPVFFTLFALQARKVKLWQRFIPLISLILSVGIPIFISFTIYYTHSYLGNFGEILVVGALEATIPQWLLFGSFAWILTGLTILRESKKSNS